MSTPSPFPPEPLHEEAPLAAEDSGWSMASGDVEQKYFVPLKMRKGDARDAVEVLLRLSDYDPMTVMASVAEHLCTKYRQRYPHAEALLRKTLMACRSDAAAMALHKRPWQPHQLNARADYAKDRSSSRASSLPPTTPMNGRAQTAPHGPRSRVARGSENVLHYRQQRQHEEAAALRAREEAEKSGRPWTVGGGANSPNADRMNHRGALASIVPSNATTNRRPASRNAKPGKFDFGEENHDAPIFPPLSAEVNQAGGMDQESMHSIRSKNPDRNMKAWMIEKKKKEMKREHAKKALVQKEKKWIADLAAAQTQRNKERRIMEERNAAAVQIQGAYRGMASRKMVKSIKEDKKRKAEEAAKEAEKNFAANEAARIFDD